MFRFRPQLLDTLPRTDRETFLSDLAAGLTVGVVALPLAIAFAIASGVGPERGLITAIVAGTLISTLGGSRVQIGGPTGAFVVLVAGIVQRHGIDGLMVATAMAGMILVVGGMFRAGSMIRYIPLPVIAGFTAAIALVIAAGQVADALGMAIVDQPAALIPKIPLIADNLRTTSPAAVAITAVTMAMMISWPKRWSRIPSPFAALVITTAVAAITALPVDTIGSRFGELPRGLPSPSLPTISVTQFPELIGPAFTIALLGAIESLLSAVVADSMTGQRHRSNTELVAQGVANIAAPLWGGIPATGAIARTATNVRSGGRTPLSGIFHALTLLLILLVAAPLASYIPMATLAGILLIGAWKMADAHGFMRLARGARADSLVLLTTFFFTAVADLTVGIGVGMAVAALLFLQRMTNAAEVHADDEWKEDIRRALLPDDVRLLEVRGPLFFGAADKLRAALDLYPEHPRVLLVDLEHASGMDVTAARTLAAFASRSADAGSRVIFITDRPPVALALRQEGLERAASFDRALHRISVPGRTA